MASTFRKGGTFAAFTWAGAITHPSDTADFAAVLQRHRFRTIENAASEEVSVGWVTPEDPSGDSFDDGDMDGGSATWLRVRVDRKVLPKATVAQHVAAATRAKGRQLSARERRELKDDLCEKLLPRVLPSTASIDALVFFERRRVLLFAGGKSAREAFGKLWFETFGVPLDRLGPGDLAAQHVDAAAVAKLDPTRWPRAKGAA